MNALGNITFGGNQDVTFERTPHRVQAVVHADGAIDLSYQVVTACDAIVGVFPVPSGPAPESAQLGTIRRMASSTSVFGHDKHISEGSTPPGADKSVRPDFRTLRAITRLPTLFRQPPDPGF